VGKGCVFCAGTGEVLPPPATGMSGVGRRSDVLYPWLADASWLRVGGGGLLASNGFCWWELVVVVDVVPKGLAGEGPPYPTGLRGGREPRESRSTRRAFSPKNWSSTLPGCVL